MSRHLAVPVIDRDGQRWRVLFAIAVSAAVWSQVAWGQLTEHRALLAIDLAAGATAFWLMGRRTEAPFLVALGLNALAAFSGLASGPQTVALVSVAARRKVWEIAALVVAFLVSAVIFWRFQPLEHHDALWYVVLLNALLVTCVTGWGILLGQQRDLMTELQSKAEMVAAEQEDALEGAKTNERQVIAREMHDVLAHRITQLSMQAGAMSYRQDLNADQLRSGIGLIQAQANEALADLRGVLGVLRDPTSGAAINRPQPTYADLPALFAEANDNGVPIDLINQIDPDLQVPLSTGRTLYRIMQEAITNARKHALGTRLYVELVGSSRDGVTFVVRNPVTSSRPFAPGSGLGLVGLAERAQLLGGRLSHGTRGDVFELRGWLPWQA